MPWFLWVLAALPWGIPVITLGGCLWVLVAAGISATPNYAAFANPTVQFSSLQAAEGAGPRQVQLTARITF